MTQTPGGDCIRTLVVEDNRDICENIGEYLDARGHITDYAHGVGITTRFDLTRASAI